MLRSPFVRETRRKKAYVDIRVSENRINSVDLASLTLAILLILDKTWIKKYQP